MKQKIGVKRVQAQIKRVVANFLLHDLNDPRKGFMTVTRVELTPDYRSCKVYVSIMGENTDQSRVLHMLASARGLVQRRVAKALSTRVTPHLEFQHDQSLEKSARIDSIFEKIAAERSEDSEASDQLKASDKEAYETQVNQDETALEADVEQN